MEPGQRTYSHSEGRQKGLALGHDHHHLNHREQRKKETQQVTIVSSIVNLLLAGIKIVVGYFAQSHALIADGIHSFSDLLSDLLVWFAAHHAAQEPDEEHPYGHGRFETAATLGLGILLLLVAGGIIWDAVDDLVWSHGGTKPGSWALYAAAFSILANEALYWYTLAVAKRINSEMLRANAWHHRTDAISSIVVLVGVGGALLGLGYLDAIAAVVVGLMVAKIGWDLGWEAMQELVDKALDEDRVAKARKIIEGVDGVKSLHLLRTRRHAHEAAADVHVLVSPWLSVSEGHMISLTVEQRLKQGMREITDVTVHVDPEDDEEAPPCEGLPLRQEALRQLDEIWSGLACLGKQQKILLHYLSGRIDVQVFFPASCYGDVEQLNSMRSELQRRLDENANFGRVEVYFS